MKLKISRPRRYITGRLKNRVGLFLVVWAVLACANMFMANSEFTYKGDSYKFKNVASYDRGQRVEFTDKDEFCHSWVIVPGTSMISEWLLAIAYFFALVYLFLGIALVSDIFMDCIEVITSQTKTETYTDLDGIEQSVTIFVWNPTIANLTLMALGSSAPEILLSVIETVTSLGKEPGELGPSTIVGSAAFNLMVISAVSIAVIPTGEIKKINDLGVFYITSASSVFAYIWMLIVLEAWTPGVVSIYEAIITFGLFWILIVCAFIADKIRQRKENKSSLASARLIRAIMEGAEGQALGDDDSDTGNAKHQELQKYLKEAFGKDNIKDIDPTQVEEMMKPKSVVSERIKYRKSLGNMISGRQKVTVKKGEKQLEELKTAHDEFQAHELNPRIGFRCLHYSVTESIGTLQVVILKKNPEEKVTFGVRTIDGTATAAADDDAGDYTPVDKEITMEEGKSQISIPIKINDDEGCEPDEDFYLEIYDVETKERIVGEDTKTTITILDDDKPGIFGFEVRTVKTRAKDEKIRLKVMRLDGCDDDIIISYKTFVPEGLSNAAEPSVDYMPCEGSLTFETGETMKVVEVGILPKEGDDASERDDVFAVKIFDPKYALDHKNQTEGIEKPKLGKKSECFVEIVSDDELVQKVKGIEKMIEMLRQEEDATWCGQFKKACMLSPQLDEEGKMVDVSCLDATLHFCTIGWKLAFAIIPPAKMCKGWLAFVVSLIMIGIITAVVGEIATLFGCVIGLKPAATAITFVALGTSLPDTFASKTAATQSEYADSAIGNVTGSNSVNVFLGLGIPWIIGSIYSLAKDVDYKVNTKGLSFSVMLFLGTSL